MSFYGKAWIATDLEKNKYITVNGWTNISMDRQLLNLYNNATALLFLWCDCRQKKTIPHFLLKKKRHKYTNTGHAVIDF